MKKRVIIFLTVMVSTLLFTSLVLGASGKSQLGVYLQELDDYLRAQFYYKGDGVLVTEVIKGCGADRAGLKKGDIIIEFNGKEIDDIRDLERAIRRTRPGDKVEVEIYRDKENKKLAVDMSEKKKRTPHYLPEKWVHFAGDERPWMGIHMQELNPQLAEYFKVKTGVLIKEVVKDSPAEIAGLKAGDVIIEWGRKIDNLKDMYRRLDKSEAGEEIELTIVRNGNKEKRKLMLAEPEDDNNSFFGFYFDEDDSGDMVFRMKKRGMSHWREFLHNLYSDREQQQESEDSIKKTYEETIQELKEGMQELREELDEIKTKKE